MALLFCMPLEAQFVERFEGDDLEGWTYATGDGRASVDMQQRDGFASIEVDATQDRDNIWWALARRDVSDSLDLVRLNEPHHELRIEARIRVSHAPRRVNLHLNTQRTTDFHSHLLEFDIPDTTAWHTISMTTRNFDARPGDSVNGQLALMDWGTGTYRVDLDYFRVDVVDTNRIGSDSGEQIVYNPPIPSLNSFEHHVRVDQGAMIDLQHPDVSLEAWYASGAGGVERVLTVDAAKYVLLRWNFDAVPAGRVSDPGLLTLVTHSVQRAPADVEEYGQIRVAEITGGDPKWNEETVTAARFAQGRPMDEVVNPQMIVDVRVAEGEGDTTFVTVSRPVLQRLIDGRTRGLLLRPLGPITASFFGRESREGAHAPVLHFDLEATGP